MNPKGWMLSPGKTLHPVYILDPSSHHDFRPQNHLPSFSNYPTPSPAPSPYATYPPTPQIYENSMNGMSHQNGVLSQLVSPISGYQHSYSTPVLPYQILPSTTLVDTTPQYIVQSPSTTLVGSTPQYIVQPPSTTLVGTTPQYIVQPPLAHVSIGSAGTMEDSCGIAELKETIEKVTSELDQLRTKISELNAKVREQEECLSTAQTEMSNLRKEHAQAQTEMNNLREENAQTKTEMSNLQEENAQAQTEMSNLREQNAQAQTEISNLREENAQLASSLKEVQDCQGCAEDRIKKFERLLREKETELIRVQDCQGRAGDRIQKLEQQLREKETELIKVQGCQGRAGDRIQKLEQQLREKETELIKVQDCQGRAGDRIQKLEQQLREKETELIKSEEKCWVVQEKLDLAGKKLAQFSEEPVTAAEECLAQISFPLVEKDGNSGVVKYDSNIKHLLKRKKPDEESKENNVKTIKLTGILKGDSKTKKKLKLSKTMEKSCPSNPHLICNKEVVIQLESLNDSTVTEMTACGSAFPPKQVNKSSDDAVGINSLPDEIIEKIFGYFTQNKLGQIARVCRRWNVLAKSPDFWRKVNVKIFLYFKEKNSVVKSFINGLPSCVTFLRLDFPGYDFLDFEELCVRLHKNCPHVEELIMINLNMSYLLTEVINFCTQFLQCVKKLVFHNCTFYDYSRRVELNDNSKIEVLDLFRCSSTHFNKKQFSKLLYLKELRLADTRFVTDTWFEDDTSFFNQLHVLDVSWTYITLSTFLAIQRHGHNLKELYLCKCNLGYRDLNFNNSMLPHLKTICLRGCYVKCEGVVSLIQSCPSLENVYVKQHLVRSLAAHPLVVANTCKSGIVKAIDFNHNHKVDYSHT